MGQHRPTSYNGVFTLKQREEGRTGHNNTIQKTRVPLGEEVHPRYRYSSAEACSKPSFRRAVLFSAITHSDHKPSLFWSLLPSAVIFEHKRNESLFTVYSSLVTADLF